jgi:hypothetical protein
LVAAERASPAAGLGPGNPKWGGRPGSGTTQIYLDFSQKSNHRNRRNQLINGVFTLGHTLTAHAETRPELRCALLTRSSPRRGQQLKNKQKTCVLQQYFCAFRNQTIIMLLYF